MENAHVITINRRTFKTAEAFEDWNKWAKGSLVPMVMSSDTTLGIERWLSLAENLIYTNTMAISYYKDMESYIVDSRGAERNAYYKDITTTWGGKFEQSWNTVYLLIRRFKGNQTTPIDKGDIVDKTTRLKEFPEGSEPVLLLRGLGLSPDEWGKYDAWVNEWGYDVYVPLLLKVPGIIEYCRFWLSNIGYQGLTPKPGVTENPDHPQDLSIIYFENLKAYQNFRKSKELAVYDKTLSAAFPGGLNYKWDAAYRLMRRWSR